MSTLSEAITAYRICAKAEGKSPRTIEWITSSIGYFTRFLGRDADIATITADNLRRFIVGMLDSYRYADHPFARPQNNKISPQSVKTYARAIRAFIGYLHREELIEHNPMKKVKMTRVPKKVVPTFSEREVKKLLAQPDKNNDRGFRDYTLLLTYIDIPVPGYRRSLC